MGDIADWMLASQDPFGMDEDDEECEYGGAQPRRARCRRCGSTDVRWRQQGGKWVLFSLQPGVEHVCELNSDDFDVVQG